MEVKQTAIDWLVEQVNSDCLNSSYIRIELVKEAKEMEQVQKETEYRRGFKDGQQYYKEEYGNKTLKSK